MRVSHRFTAGSARFDEDNLVSARGAGAAARTGRADRAAEIIAEKVSITTPRIKSGAANPAPKLLGRDRGDVRRRGQHRRPGRATRGRDADPVRRRVRALHPRDTVAGVHLRPRPPTGIGAPRTPGRPGRTHRAAGRDRRAGVHRHRLAAAPGLRARQAGRLLRPHQDRRQAGAAQGTLAAGHHDQHRALPRR